MGKKKVWLCVFLWRGLLHNVRITSSERGAMIIFKKVTGIRFSDYCSFKWEDDLKHKYDPADNWGGSDILGDYEI